MILIDTPFNNKSHLVGSTIEELHQFASSIGLKRCWFQNKRKKKGWSEPHYDVIGQQRISLAIKNGANFVSRKELLTFLKEQYASR